MKILLLLPYLKRGGTETQAAYIANYLGKQGHEVIVVSIENISDSEPLFEVPILYLDSKNRLPWVPFLLLRLLRLLKKGSYDLILSRAWASNSIASLLSLISGRPAVLFLSSSTDLSNHHIFIRWIHRILYKCGRKIIAVSEQARNNGLRWLKLPPEQTVVIHNGVDPYLMEKLARAEGYSEIFLDKTKPQLLFAGRLIHRKGADLIIHAIQQIRGTHSVHLIIAGDGELLTALQKQAAELDLKDAITFTGEVEHPFTLMKNADMFILPSRSEGFPNVLLEAMAAGIPVIASDCDSGPREIIDGSNGILVPVDDSAAIAAAIKEILDQPVKAKKMGQNAKKTINQRFLLQEQLKHIETELVSVIK